MLLKKAGSILSTILIIVLSLLLVGTILLKFVFHVQLKAVVTGSMEPELPVGSLLVISPIQFEDINIGDDITFVRDEKLTLVTHRVIEKNETRMTITTKGIANNTKDAPTDYRNVVGKVRFCIPVLGYVGLWLSTPTGIIIVITVLILLIIIGLLIRVIFTPSKEDKAEETDNEAVDKDSKKE